MVRAHFPREFFEKAIDPETMSAFVKSSLSKISSDLQVKRKSVLIQELSSVWGKNTKTRMSYFFNALNI